MSFNPMLYEVFDQCILRNMVKGKNTPQSNS